MRRRSSRALAALAVLLAAFTSTAFAVEATARRAVGVDYATLAAGSLGRDASSASVRLPIRADLLGVTWSGAARELELRAKGPDGRWSRWVELHADPAHGPDPRTAEARSARRSSGRGELASEPVWVGAADVVQLRSSGASARGIRVVAINATASATRAERAATRLRTSAAKVLGAGQPSAQAMPGNPGIRSRTLWGASTPRNEPALATETGVLGAVVHHTAATNGYSCSQVPALLRGIQRYHMRTQGWNDIGYNFLVDRCGGVWEGRAGGITRPVIGAHSSGFNTSTTGIALMGTHGRVRPTTKARIALQRLIAWRLDIAHVKPTGKMALTARTSDKHPVGSRVAVRAVSGHRDVFPTSCPGAVLYSDLNAIAGAAWRIGGAKVANITKRWTLLNPSDPLDPTLASVTIRGTASHADMQLALRLQRISTGEVLHEAGVTGTVITSTWTPPPGVRVPTWDTRLVLGGTRTSTMQRARTATLNLVSVPPDPGFVVTTPPAATVAPGGDPADDLVHLEYTLGQDYRLGAWLHDPATGAQVAALLQPTYVGVTGTPAPLDLAIPASVVDGAYELRIGLPADPAAGRSMRRFTLRIERA